MLETTKDFKELVLNEIPLIDVRAPIEFEKGAFPGAVNLPILNNKERETIGIEYKNAGNEMATALGHEIVSGENKAMKIKAWTDFIDANPNAMLYCFRGGSRSRIAQQWLHEAGYPIVRLEGGYKAFRRFLLEALEPKNQDYKPVRLTGHTGSAKTDILLEIDNMIDLEGIANHRGSAFGDYATGQPAQIDFENVLAYDLITKQAKGYKHIVFEDEGRNVGKRFIPKDLVDFTRDADYVVLEVPFDERVQITLDNYVIDSIKEYIDFHGDDGAQQWHDYIVTSFNKILKKLGGQNHKILLALFEEAYSLQLTSNDYSKHKEWIAWLLKDYYDPMYSYQMDQIANNIVFTGDRDSVLDYLNKLD